MNKNVAISIDELDVLLDKINKSAVLMDEIMSNYFNKLDPSDSGAITFDFKMKGFYASMAEDYVHEVRDLILDLTGRSQSNLEETEV